MNIYSLNERYINYLQKFDGRVCISKLNQAFGRKYVGVVFQINDVVYFAPLSNNPITLPEIDVLLKIIIKNLCSNTENWILMFTFWSLNILIG